MATIRVSREDARDLLDDAIEDRIIGIRRWSLDHEAIIHYQGTTYRTRYSHGATEAQDERPWQYEDFAEFVEVHAVERVVKVWEPVAD